VSYGEPIAEKRTQHSSAVLNRSEVPSGLSKTRTQNKNYYREQIAEITQTMLEKFKYPLFALVSIAILIGVAVLLLDRPDPVVIEIVPPAPTATPAPTGTPAPIQVYVTGAVNDPFVTVELPHDSRVDAAIRAAGGFAENANRVAVNLAAPLKDGDQVHVPELNAENTATPPITATQSLSSTPEQTPATAIALVNVNTATLEELVTLPEIGPATAQAIIDYRTQNGPFTSLEDLDAVPGIGAATLEAIRPFVTF
jgi:competence protein ComEA